MKNPTDVTATKPARHKRYDEAALASLCHSATIANSPTTNINVAHMPNASINLSLIVKTNFCTSCPS